MPCSEAHTPPWPNKRAPPPPPFGSKTRLNNQDQEVDIVRELICGTLCIKTSRILSNESNRQHIVSSIDFDWDFNISLLLTEGNHLRFVLRR